VIDVPDVDVDSRGLVYIVDRCAGFDILEFSRQMPAFAGMALISS